MTTTTRLTMKQAAEALGVSDKTIRRRIEEGAFSATKEVRGKREVWIIDAAELARYAQTTGQILTPQGDTDGQRATRDGSWDGQDAVQAPSTATQTPPQVPRVPPEVRTEIDTLRRELDVVVNDRDYLRRILENIVKALPPAPAEPQVSAEEYESRLASLTDELERERAGREQERLARQQAELARRRAAEQQQEMAEWLALPWWKRWRMPKPSSGRN